MVRRNGDLRELTDKFVCVRIVKANDLDLTLFQFDFDLTFAVCFMNADRTIYARYGRRSSRENATKDVSLAGLASTMSEVLELHQQYPGNRSLLLGKQAVANAFRTPDDFPALRGKFKKNLDYDGAVTKSCLHCHQIGDAERQIYRNLRQPIPDRILFPYPSPAVLGLSMDVDKSRSIAKVASDSIADQGGLQSGDQFVTLNGQRIISPADIQWVLHHAAATDRLSVEVQRGNRRKRLQLLLPNGWRRESDISWRVSSWPLRRMGTGGLLLKAATIEQRRRARIPQGRLALVVKHVGQYGPHAAAKRAGFRPGDMVVSFNGRTDQLTPSQLLAYTVQETKPAQRLPVIVVRGEQRVKLMLPMQK